MFGPSEVELPETDEPADVPTEEALDGLLGSLKVEGLSDMDLADCLRSLTRLQHSVALSLGVGTAQVRPELKSYFSEHSNTGTCPKCSGRLS